jgi:hypothetical protein
MTWNRPRGVLSAVVAIVLAAASVALALEIKAYLYRLPDPATADREGVLRWLVLADLAEHPDDVSRQLVARVEAVFGAESDVPDSDAGSLTDAEHERVRRNTERLKETWFREKVAAYHQLPAGERAAFLDAQIRTLFHWAKLDQRLDRPASDASAAAERDLGDYLGAFFDALDRWRAAAAPDESERMRVVVKAGLVRWLATYDLADQSPGVLGKVVAGLEQQLGTELDFSGVSRDMSSSEVTQFWRNVERLAATWFFAKSTEYVALAGKERDQFVARQMPIVQQLIEHWPRDGAETSAESPTQRIERWLATAPEAMRGAARQFYERLRGELFGNAIRSLLPAQFNLHR